MPSAKPLQLKTPSVPSALCALPNLAAAVALLRANLPSPCPYAAVCNSTGVHRLALPL